MHLDSSIESNDLVFNVYLNELIYKETSNHLW